MRKGKLIGFRDVGRGFSVETMNARFGHLIGQEVYYRVEPKYDAEYLIFPDRQELDFWIGRAIIQYPDPDEE
jgi:hypothetical protein